jgi:hypothetical protein
MSEIRIVLPHNGDRIDVRVPSRTRSFRRIVIGKWVFIIEFGVEEGYILPHTGRCAMRFTLLEYHVARDEDAFRTDVLDLVVASTTRVSQKTALNTPLVKFRTPSNLCTIYRRYLRPAFSAECTKVRDVLAFT